MRWSSVQRYRTSNAELIYASFFLVPLAPILAGFSHGARDFYDACTSSMTTARTSTPTPKWQEWVRERQPRLLVIWGKYDPSFDISEPEAYRRDVPNAEVHVLDAGHFALDTKADEIAALWVSS